jgi:NIPSNAP
VTYVLAFATTAARDEAWAAFSADPEWRRLAGDPQYRENVSAISDIILSPAASSQV